MFGSNRTSRRIRHSERRSEIFKGEYLPHLRVEALLKIAGAFSFAR
jgi:hypothetical protein